MSIQSVTPLAVQVYQESVKIFNDEQEAIVQASKVFALEKPELSMEDCIALAENATAF